MNDVSNLFIRIRKKNNSFLVIFPIIFYVITGIFSCKSDESDTNACLYNILAILAHPDDETLISGTLAKLAAKGCDVTVVYVTSGDDGPDMTGRNLHGTALGKIREQEARKSMDYIGIENPPLFLKLPDSFVSAHIDELVAALAEVFVNAKPDVVITFGPDGITGDHDHITTGFVTDYVFDSTRIGTVLLHMAVSQNLKYVIPARVPVTYKTIDLEVDVSAYRKARARSVDAHRTQFRKMYGLIWRRYVHRVPIEEFIIARNKGEEKAFLECFE